MKAFAESNHLFRQTSATRRQTHKIILFYSRLNGRLPHAEGTQIKIQLARSRSPDPNTRARKGGRKRFTKTHMLPLQKIICIKSALHLRNLTECMRLQSEHPETVDVLEHVRCPSGRRFLGRTKEKNRRPCAHSRRTAMHCKAQAHSKQRRSSTRDWSDGRGGSCVRRH